MFNWGSSSVGRALVSHTGGLGFDSPLLHIFINQINYIYRKFYNIFINKINNPFKT